jgi:hypothetical protein
MLVSMEMILIKNRKIINSLEYKGLLKEITIIDVIKLIKIIIVMKII